MSDQPTIVQALTAVMADVGAVSKDGHNPQGNFSFRGIDAVVNAASPALRRHGVVVAPEVLDFTYGDVEVGRNRTRMAHVTVKVRYVFHGPAGDSLAATVPGEAMDSGDKATAKAMSVAFRVALLQTLALPTHEPDPDATLYERSDAPAPPRTAGDARADLARWAQENGQDLKAVASRWESDYDTKLGQADSAEQIDAFREMLAAEAGR